MQSLIHLRIIFVVLKGKTTLKNQILKFHKKTSAISTIAKVFFLILIPFFCFLISTNKTVYNDFSIQVLV